MFSSIGLTLDDTPFTPEDFLNKLFPNFWSWLINFLALIVLFVVVYFIAYKPVKKFIKARKDYVDHNIHDSEQAKAISERKAKEAEESISSAHAEADSIIKKAKADASIKAGEVMAEANSTIAKKRKDADEAIKLEEEKSKKAISDEIVNIAMDASQKVLGRSVTSDDNKRLVNDFVKDVQANDKPRNERKDG